MLELIKFGVFMRLNREGHIESPDEATSEEERLQAVIAGAKAIQDELKQAFQDIEEAQQARLEVEEQFVKHHFEYFGYDYEEHKAAV